MNQITPSLFNRMTTFRLSLTARHLGLLCGCILWANGPLAAQTPGADGNTWVSQTFAESGLARIGGSTTDLTFMVMSNGSDLRQYNATTQSWEIVDSWTSHFATSGGWSGSLTSVAVSGSTIYVGGGVNQLGYSNDGGLTWSNISLTHGFTGDRAVSGIYASGTQAYVLRQNGYTNLIVNGAESPLTNNRPMGNVTFQAEGASGIVGIGSRIWITNNASSGGDAANSVRSSSTFGVGSGAWSSAVTATGGGAFGGLFAMDENTLYKAGGNDTIGISTNGGSSFTTITLGMSAGTTRSVYAESDESIWVGASNGLFYYNGELWQNLSGNLPGYEGENIRGLYHIDGQLWATGLTGGVWMAVPEPSSLVLAGFGAVVTVAGVIRRRQRKEAI